MYFLKDKGCYYFPEIAPLYRTMRASDVDIDRFSFAFAGAKFDVVFAINRKPFELMFGCVGHGKCNFILTMEKGYMLSPISDEVFETLCRVLHLSYRGDRFTSYKFLQHVASKVPQKYSGHKIQPHEVAQVRNDIPDKKRFILCAGIRTFEIIKMLRISKKLGNCAVKKLPIFASEIILARVGQQKLRTRMIITIHGMLSCNFLPCVFSSQKRKGATIRRT